MSSRFPLPIHRISSLVFVGKSHRHSPIWTGAVTALPADVEITKFILLPFPAFVRRFLAPLIRQRNRVFPQPRRGPRPSVFTVGKLYRQRRTERSQPDSYPHGRRPPNTKYDADVHPDFEAKIVPRKRLNV
ncbi:hypothetical protein GGR54DRAFT_644623 [Hypoxylon sp. NC1633]|nr:hypothetical protein GGR54DRAFT_644623 [Hypoxylon sp. NC1633]